MPATKKRKYAKHIARESRDAMLRARSRGDHMGAQLHESRIHGAKHGHYGAWSAPSTYVGRPEKTAGDRRTDRRLRKMREMRDRSYRASDPIGRQLYGSLAHEAKHRKDVSWF